MLIRSNLPLFVQLRCLRVALAVSVGAWLARLEKPRHTGEFRGWCVLADKHTFLLVFRVLFLSPDSRPAAGRIFSGCGVR